jgi:hypothetical protein
MEIRFNRMLTALPHLRRSVRRLFFDEEDAMEIRVLFMDAPGSHSAAEARATQLLIRVLDPMQRQEYLRYGCFTVEAPGWGRFQILSRSVFNVLSMETGLAYCAAPNIPVPIPDLMLSQKLLLEHDPGRFFQVANQRRQDYSRSNVSL